MLLVILSNRLSYRPVRRFLKLSALIHFDSPAVPIDYESLQTVSFGSAYEARPCLRGVAELSNDSGLEGSMECVGGQAMVSKGSQCG